MTVQVLRKSHVVPRLFAVPVLCHEPNRKGVFKCLLVIVGGLTCGLLHCHHKLFACFLL